MAAKSSTVMNTTMFWELRDNDKAVVQFVPKSGTGISKGGTSMSMKKKKIIKIIVAAFAGILLVSAISIYSIPKLRVSLFVHFYHDWIEESLAVGHGVPADDAVLLGYDVVNSWDGAHSMTEFVIMSQGNTYYGCYYSPDDVPIAFQNTDTELTQDGHDYWEWEAEEDNHGTTSKIIDHWYYFEAAF